MSDLARLESEILTAIAAASDEAVLEAVRRALGKKGSISALLATLGKMSPDERKTEGAKINLAKDKVTEALTARRDILKNAALDARLASETIDVTLPTRETLPSRAASIRSRRSGTNSSRSSPTWASRWRKVRTSRPTTTTSPS
jgi:phenylalanyl-tRNA synthetase alpha subunit